MRNSVRLAFDIGALRPLWAVPSLGRDFIRLFGRQRKRQVDLCVRSRLAGTVGRSHLKRKQKSNWANQ